MRLKKIMTASMLSTVLVASALAPSMAQEVAPPHAGSTGMGGNSPLLGERLMNSQDALSLIQQPADGSKAAGLATPEWGILGQDVSSHQPFIDWNAQKAAGSRFSYVKISEGTYYTNPYRSSQLSGARGQGMFTGGYHFATPSTTNGATQAKFFVANGGGWSADGTTLPGLLDLEWNPYSVYGNQCYNLSQGELRRWVTDFANEYKNLTGRYPAVYTAKIWWDACVGSADFSYMPLHLANYQSRPAGAGAWSNFDLWQYSDADIFAGDSNVFNGTVVGLGLLASNPGYVPLGASVAAELKLRAEYVPPFTDPTYALRGGIGAYYWANGAEQRFGAPKNNEYAAAHGGYAQDFSLRHSIYWHPSTGAHSLRWGTGFSSAFAQSGGLNGFGYPLTDETATSFGGGKQEFLNPSTHRRTVAMWHAQTGVRIFNGLGAIYNKWQSKGGLGTYGYPVTHELDHGDGVVQYTRNVNSGGETVFSWDADTGITTAVNSRGSLYDAWVNNGWVRGLGYPIHDERVEADGRVHIRYSKGAHFTWSASEGVRRVR